MSLPGSYVRDFLQVVTERGLAVEPLLAGLPVDIASLRLPATKIPIVVCEAIIARAVEQIDECDLAIGLGMKIRETSHGFLGFAAMTAETIRDALDLVVRFASTRVPTIQLALYVDGPSASIVLEERAQLPHLVQRVLVMAVFIELAITAGRWTGVTSDFFIECAFPHNGHVPNLPGNIHVRFDAPAHRVVFPASILDLPIGTADAAASRLAREQCERELALLDRCGTAARVRTLLARDEGMSSLEEIAQALKMSPRTLKRKLAESQVTFSELRDEFRRQRALLLLDNRELSIGDVALRLGYTELANFTRAFRKWTGITPHAYRSRLGST